MKSYFVFIRRMNGFTRRDVVYSVAVGTSKEEQVKYSLVREFCQDCGLYFKKRSDTTDEAVENLAKSLFLGSAFPTLHLRRATISISQLYALIIEDSFNSFEKRIVETKNTYKLITLFDPKTIKIPNFRHTKTPASAPSRKYLKRTERQEFQKAMINFGLILLTFLVASLIQATERY